MCLIGIALQATPHWPLVMALNRDELHARPTLPSSFSNFPLPVDNKRILAGRDVLAGGTWLGVQWIAQRIRIAAITNIRPGLRPAEGGSRLAPGGGPVSWGTSRGSLVRALLCDTGPRPVVELMLETSQVAERYAPFNLLGIELSLDRRTGQPGVLLPWYLHNARRVPGAAGKDGPFRMARGLHVVSNGLLDAPWPKALMLSATMDHVLGSEHPTFDTLATGLMRGLSDRLTAPDAQLPWTGLTPTRERALSAAFIVDPEYGTRASTVLAVHRDGVVHWWEQSYAPDGTPTVLVRERVEPILR